MLSGPTSLSSGKARWKQAIKSYMIWAWWGIPIIPAQEAEAGGALRF